MSTLKKTKSQSVTSEQKKAMVDYLNNHQELMKGKFSMHFTHATAAKQWAELGELLNSMIGPSKEWKAWRRTWQDMKSEIKKKSTQIRANNIQTGGGKREVSELSCIDEMVLGMIGDVVVSGDPQINESTVNFSYESNSQSFQAPPLIVVPYKVNDEDIVNTTSNTDNNSAECTNDMLFVMPDNETAQVKSTNLMTTPPDYQPSTSTEGNNNMSINSPNITIGKRKSEQKTKKYTKKERLEHTARAQKDLSLTSNERNNIVKEYYTKKIEYFKELLILKERSTIAKEKSASAQEKIAEALQFYTNKQT